MAFIMKKLPLCVRLLRKQTLTIDLTSKKNTISASKLVYDAFGEPANVLKMQKEEIDCIKANELMVRMLAAPVNPADINTIQGKYPVKVTLPAVGGNEGVGEVIDVGTSVKDFSPGDRVVLLKSGLGTWRTHMAIDKNNVIKVPPNVGLAEAASLTVNPCTAFRMLRDFVDLKPGDVMIQNGGNSACAQNVMQICRVWGIYSVNIVRNRPNIQELKDYLLGMGATHVLTEEELKTTTLFKDKKLPQPKLALNCVGGASALAIMKQLVNGGCMVTYGGMSKQPVTVPTPALIFRNIHVRGFWVTEWSRKNADSEERFEMFEELICMLMNKQLKAPVHEMVKFDNFQKAITNALSDKGMLGKKYILEF